MSLAALWGLFFAAFAAATLLPAQSELALAGLLAAGRKPVWLLIAVATAGNTLGAAVNWLLGRYCLRFQNRRWFPVKKKSMDKAATWYGRYGRWSLLLSWAPVIGDPLTLAAGLLREPFASFILIVGLAKLGRYLVVAGAALHWLA
ncbi:YqaA family protein [Desulfovibrio sp. SGI.169]|uniref:YqaA family protein n=1 Tax=Desulfovibrio sp. SGI.169 TaxID=3420561 RepID=UPI003D089DD5